MGEAVSWKGLDLQLGFKPRYISNDALILSPNFWIVFEGHEHACMLQY